MRAVDLGRIVDGREGGFEFGFWVERWENRYFGARSVGHVGVFPKIRGLVELFRSGSRGSDGLRQSRESVGLNYRLQLAKEQGQAT
jgi:hypothetical protein